MNQLGALFRPYTFGDTEKDELDRDGHMALPGLLTDGACVQLTQALAQIQALPQDDQEHLPNRHAAEFNPHLERLSGNPPRRERVRRALGPWPVLSPATRMSPGPICRLVPSAVSYSPVPSRCNTY